MKITTEQLRALQEAESRRTKTSRAAGDEFGALLTRQLDAEQPQGAAGLENAAPLASNLRTVPLAGIMEESALSEGQSVEEAMVGQMETMFGSVERYAGELARNDRADLRRAYGLLEEVGGQMAEFKSRFPNADAEQPGLAAMVNELDALVVTETFKFNRGDYA